MKFWSDRGKRFFAFLALGLFLPHALIAQERLVLQPGISGPGVGGDRVIFPDLKVTAKIKESDRSKEIIIFFTETVPFTTNDGVCFLAGIQGSFSGTAEYAYVGPDSGGSVWVIQVGNGAAGNRSVTANKIVTVTVRCIKY